MTGYIAGPYIYKKMELRVEIKEKGSGDKYFITCFNRRGSGRRRASVEQNLDRGHARVMIVTGD
jgi:hypothetical protein